MPHRKDNYITFIGIHKWFKHIVESFGWIILNADNEKKTNRYKYKIDKLLQCINKKLRIPEISFETKTDIEIIEKQLSQLKKYIDLLFTEKNKNELCTNDIEQAIKQRDVKLHSDATYYGLHKWFMHIIKKSGWVIICRHDKHKISDYRDSLLKINKIINDKKIKYESDQSTPKYILDDLNTMNGHVYQLIKNYILLKNMK